MRWIRLPLGGPFVAFFGIICSAVADARAYEPQSPREADAQALSYSDLHWSIRMGLRAEEVLHAFPVVDQVVLVPDAETYLDELGRWSPGGRWPVLFEDDHFAAMFIRAFKPAAVLRRASTREAATSAVSAEERQALIDAALVRSWGGDPAKDRFKDVLARAQVDPVGVVAASAHDPAWTAAAALAAGRGQPIAWIDGEFWGPNDELDDAKSRELITAIDRAAVELGYTYRGMGEGIDAITLCRAVGGKSRLVLRPQELFPAGGRVDDGALAITDLVGRDPDDLRTRHAFCGWVFGSESRSAYVAMCSLFLHRERALLVNGYPKGEPWDRYGMTIARQTLEGQAFNVTVREAAQVDLKGWQRFIMGGVTADVIMMNSKGNADWFHLYKDEVGYPDDVPVLNTPAAVHFIHSWSFTAPSQPASVGGQWLARGAYAYVGAVWEPFLGAFIPPEWLAQRCSQFVPFLVAARLWDTDENALPPWRVNTFGDPLMTCPPPGAVTRPRIRPAAESPAGCENLLDVAKRLMRDGVVETTGRVYGEAVRALVLLGKDDLAIDVWRLAERQNKAGGAAHWALGPLFRSRNDRDFLLAWASAGQRDDLHKAMLWHLVFPRSQTAHDDEALLALQLSIRQPIPNVDLERLLPLLRARYDAARVRSVIEREINRTEHEPTREKLQSLLEGVQ